MHNLGSILAFVFNKVFALLLILLILAAVPTLALVNTITDRGDIKTALSDGNIYDNITTHAFDIIGIETDSDSQSSLACDGLEANEGECQSASELQPDGDHANKTGQTLREAIDQNGLIDGGELVTAVKQILDPAFLQSQSEGLIDGVYDYLDGTSSTLEYELTLRERSEVAKTTLSGLLSRALADIPVCANDEQLPDGDGEFGIFDLSCIPPDGQVEAEIDMFISDLTDEEGLFGKTFTESSEDQLLNETDLAFVKIAYETSSGYAVLFWFFVICLSMAVILTAKTLHRGFKIVGVILAVLGLFIVSAAAIVGSADAVFSEAFAEDSEFSAQQTAAIEAIVEPVLSELAGDVTGRMMVLGISLAVLGIGAFVLGILLTRHHVDHLHLHHLSDEPATDEESGKVDVSKTATEPKKPVTNEDKKPGDSAQPSGQKKKPPRRKIQ